MAEHIEIDTTQPCSGARWSPDQRATAAIGNIAHDLITLRDAMKAGAEVDRGILNGFALMLQRMGATW